MNKTTAQPNYFRGALFALGGIAVGLISWILLWEMNFIAAISTFAMAWTIVYLYRLGAGSIDKKSLYIILSYIGVGVVLSILAGIIDDGMHFVMEEEGVLQGASTWIVLTSMDFWNFMMQNIFTNGELWSGYATTILMSVGLAGLGVYGTIKDVLAQGLSHASTASIPTTKETK